LSNLRELSSRPSELKPWSRGQGTNAVGAGATILLSFVRVDGLQAALLTLLPPSGTINLALWRTGLVIWCGAHPDVVCIFPTLLFSASVFVVRTRGPHVLTLGADVEEGLRKSVSIINDVDRDAAPTIPVSAVRCCDWKNTASLKPHFAHSSAAW